MPTDPLSALPTDDELRALVGDAPADFDVPSLHARLACAGITTRSKHGRLIAMAPDLARALLAVRAERARLEAALEQCRGLLRFHVEAVGHLKDRVVTAADCLDRAAGWVEHCGNPIHAGIVRDWAAEARGALSRDGDTAREAQGNARGAEQEADHG